MKVVTHLNGDPTDNRLENCAVRLTPKSPLDHSLAAETVEGHLRNIAQLLDSDGRQGFWERRVVYAAVRARVAAALALLERAP